MNVIETMASNAVSNGSQIYFKSWILKVTPALIHSPWTCKMQHVYCKTCKAQMSTEYVDMGLLQPTPAHPKLRLSHKFQLFHTVFPFYSNALYLELSM